MRIATGIITFIFAFIALVLNFFLPGANVPVTQTLYGFGYLSVLLMLIAGAFAFTLPFVSLCILVADWIMAIIVTINASANPDVVLVTAPSLVPLILALIATITQRRGRLKAKEGDEWKTMKS